MYVCFAAAVGVVGDFGQPALTAASLALAWRAASDFPAAVVVVVTFDCDCTVLLLWLDRRKAIRTTTPAMTTTIAPLRYCLRRFWD